MQRVCFQLQVRPDRMAEYRPRHAAVWPGHAPGPARDRLAQLLALPARGRPAHRLRRDRRLRRRPGRHGRAPRSTPGGRPRWPSSSSTSTAARPTQGSCVARPRCSTWRTSWRPRLGDPTRGRPDHRDSDARRAADRPPGLEGQAIELPSWAFGNSGTRFKVFAQPGRPPRSRSRRSPTPRRCTGTRASRRPSRCTSRGTRSTTTPTLARARRGARRRARHDQLEHVPGRRLQARRLTHSDPNGAAEGDRPPPRVHRHHERDRVARPQDLARRRHATTRARTTCAARQDRLADSLREDLRPRSARPAARAGVQVLRAGVLPHRRPGLGHGLRARAPRSASARWSASTPATTRRAPTSSSSSRSCCGWGSSARSTSTRASTPTTTSSSARPIRSSCSGSSSRCIRGGGLRHDVRRGVHARPVPQHRAEDPRPDPLGAQRAGDDGACAARRPRRARPRRRTAATCSARTRCLMDAFYTDVRAAARGAGARRARPARDPDGRLRGVRLPAADRRRPRVGGTQPGWRDASVSETVAKRGRNIDAAATPSSIARSNRLGADPQEHQLRRRQHLGEGHRHRPGHRRARRAAVGEGLGRRPRHADREPAWPCCASTGCARSSTSTRASSARTRWSPRSTTACTARAARRRRSTPPCTASSTPRTSTTCTPTRASRSRPPPTARR